MGSSFANKPPLTPNVRLLTLPKGPFLRITATQLAITIGSVTLTADISFERVGPVGSKVTRIALANGSITADQVGGDSPALSNIRGALVIFPKNPITSTTPPVA